MKTTGVVRRLDELGRVTLPIELRRSFQLEERDAVEIYVEGDSIILKKYIPALHASLGVYLPLITTNCTILGVTILNLDNGYDFIESIVCAAGAGIGFLVAMVLFSGVRRRVEQAVTPKCFEGLPITLVAAAVTSLSFMGFGGIVDAIFKV